MKYLFLGLTGIASVVSAESYAADINYTCKFFVRDNLAQLESEFTYEGITPLNVSLGSYRFTVNKVTQDIGDSIVLAITSSAGTSGALAPIGAPWVAAVYNPPAANNVIQSSCKLEQ